MHERDVVTEIERLFRTHGTARYGEDVSQIQHAAQAGRLALQEDGTDEMVIAAFLHDYGHLLVHEVDVTERDAAIYRHQDVGAVALQHLGFSQRVVDLVRMHADAKRYLTAVDSNYRNQLSAASIDSLEFQGGPMNAAEVIQFEARANRDDCIKLRLWDDRAKDPFNHDDDLSDFLVIIQRHLSIASIDPIE